MRKSKQQVGPEVRRTRGKTQGGKSPSGARAGAIARGRDAQRLVLHDGAGAGAFAVVEFDKSIARRLERMASDLGASVSSLTKAIVLKLLKPNSGEQWPGTVEGQRAEVVQCLKALHPEIEVRKFQLKGCKVMLKLFAENDPLKMGISQLLQLLDLHEELLQRVLGEVPAADKSAATAGGSAHGATRKCGGGCRLRSN